MDYALARELKDAGFVQHGSGSFLPHEDTVHGAGVNLLDAATEDKWPVYVPTLEELIEACGTHFFALQKWNIKFGKDWVATNGKGRPELKEGKGSTPTEAVARLWLALHPRPTSAPPLPDPRRITDGPRYCLCNPITKGADPRALGYHGPKGTMCPHCGGENL